MLDEQLFLDTSFALALLNKRDRFHEIAKSLFARVQAAKAVFVTEAVLLEIGNALSGYDRASADGFIRNCFSTGNIQVIPLERELFFRGLDLFRARNDKQWSLTDCISFVAMEDRRVRVAAAFDSDFIQAGFQTLSPGV